MIITAKIVAICLGLACTAFTVSTIVLAVQKSNLEDELQEARDKLDRFDQEFNTSTTPTTTTTTASTTTTATTTTTTQSPTPEQPINYRLPNTMFPTHYDLYLNPNIVTGNFSGQIRITINVTEVTDRIVLHANYLDITSAYLFLTTTATMRIKNYYLEKDLEFLVVELTESLSAGTRIGLGLLFEGRMLGKIVGLYSSSYLKPDSSRKSIATSKFEPTYARQAFPCFDEPNLKARFTITLVHPKAGNYHALSNMDIVEQRDQGEFVEVTFRESVPMSTYLACFIVSDFISTDVEIDAKGIGENFTMRVFATPEQLSKTQFATDVGKKVIEYYIDYFQIEYPLPKLDMAAIPDFVSGAMEHWGLVTYRETSLLYDPAVSSTYNKQRIASVIAHEFAHMWFGNLVTMDWWNDLWLNEGFASYIENKGVEAVFSDWDMLDQFLIDTLHGVLSLDATLGSHPIIQKVENPDQITEIFDTITYSKGSSIIRMLEDFLGPEVFRIAVTNYLNTYKYKNAVTSNFFTEIDELDLDINVTEIMRTWTEQMGFPVVEVQQITPTQLKLTQKRFFSNPNDYDGVYNDSPFNYTWSIPITYKTSGSAQVQRVWFYYYQNEITINLPSAVQWIKFNFDQIGYYRVNYPEAMWENLANNLVSNPSVFSVGDRASLLNDAFSLADSTQLPYDIALDMTRYLSKESDYVPWNVAAGKLTQLNRKLMFTETFRDFKKYASELIRPIYEQVTWTVSAEEHLNNRLRVTVLRAACSLELDTCLDEAAKQFEAWLAKPSERPHPDLRENVYYYGMKARGDEKTWEQTWQLFVDEKDAQEKDKLMYGLAAVQSPWILSRFINLAWNESYVRSQDYFACLSYISGNPIGEPLVWEYVREHWLDLVDRFGINERYLGNMIPSITGRFSTQTKLEEMQYFFDKYPNAGAGTAARVRALENVKNNIVWLEQNELKIKTWLEKQQN